MVLLIIQNSRSLAIAVLTVLFVSLAMLLFTIIRKLCNVGSRLYQRFQPTDTAEFEPARSSELCPICLENAHLPVKTNCDHMFCASCLQGYWDHGTWYGAMDCPLCRIKVSYMLPDWTTEMEEKTPKSLVKKLKDFIKVYNWRFSNERRSWWRIIREYPLLLQHFWDTLINLRHHALGPQATDFILNARIVIVVVMAVLYILSPFDIVPEGVLGILGSFDDISLLLLLGAYVASLWRDRMVDLW